MTGHAGFDQLWMPVYSHERMCDDDLFARALDDALVVLRNLPQFTEAPAAADKSPKRSSARKAGGGPPSLSELGDFALRLLEPEPERRLTASAALAHRWIVDEPPADHCGWG